MLEYVILEEDEPVASFNNCGPARQYLCKRKLGRRSLQAATALYGQVQAQRQAQGQAPRLRRPTKTLGQVQIGEQTQARALRAARTRGSRLQE